jgi:WD40 repeat protein
MTDIFISYSRKDKEFVRKLHEALSKQNRDTWVDWENIPLTADWWKEIEAGIEAANTFIFVISPDSIGSKVCTQEIEHALQCNKRLVPIVRRDDDVKDVHPALAKHNWLFFRESDDFDSAFEFLIKALDTDLEHVKTHTRLLQRAIEWDTKGRDRSFVLRGNDLKEAQQWCTESSNKEPKPTPLQTQYIISSSQNHINHQRRTIGAIGVGLIMTTGLALIALYNYLQAEERGIQASVALSEAQFANNDQLGALIEGVKAAKQLKNPLLLLNNIAWQTSDIDRMKIAAIATLEKILFNSQQRTRLDGHTARVWDAEFSPDGQLIASASGDNKVILWNHDGSIKETLPHPGQVYAVTFSPDGKLIASADGENTITIWNRDRKRWKTLTGHSDSVNSVKFSPDGKWIASGSNDKTIKLWRLDEKSPQPLTIGQHQASVNSISFSRDGQWLASASDDGTIKLWNLDRTKNKPPIQLDKLDTYVNSVSFSPDRKWIAYASNKSIKLWKHQGNGKWEASKVTFKGHSDIVNSVNFSRNSQQILSASADNTVKLWNLDGTVLDTFQGHSDSVSSASFSQDDKKIVTASADNTVRLWNSSTLSRQNSQLLTGHKDTVYSVSFSPDGKQLASASADYTIKLWTTDGRQKNASPLFPLFKEHRVLLREHQDVVNSVNISPNGKWIASGSDDKTVILWSTQGKWLQKLHGSKSEQNSEIRTVAFSPDSQLIGAGSHDGKILLWNWERRWMKIWSDNQSSILSISFSRDNQQIATAHSNGKVNLWNLNGEGKPYKSWNAHDNSSVQSVSFSPNGQWIVTAGADKTVKIWHRDGKLWKTLTGHSDRVNSVAFSHDSKLLASGSQDKTVILWKIDDKHVKIINILQGHNAGVKTVRFSSNGKMLASASADNTIRLWQIDRDAKASNLDKLLQRGCDRLFDYLKHNPNVKDNEKKLCDSIVRQPSG